MKKIIAVLVFAVLAAACQSPTETSLQPDSPDQSTYAIATD